MYKHKFIIDTDSLIKLTKAGIIKEVCKNFGCVITREIYDEAVTQGKERLHQDAYKIEELTKKKLVKVSKKKLEDIEIRKNLGEGEKSIYSLYKNSKNTTIVSDDNIFINFLREEKEKFIIPATFITILKSMNRIDSKQASNHLNKMKPYIKPKVYSIIKNNLGGEK